MVEFPKIPTRFFYTGNKIKAKELIGFGKKRYSDLLVSLAPMGLETGFNTYKGEDGIIIKTSQSYGISNIHIHVPIDGEKEISIEEYFECLCFPCITIGEITAVKNQDGSIICQGEGAEDCVEDYSNEEMATGLRYTYDVELCITSKKKTSKSELVIALEGFEILSTGWERLEVGRSIFAMFIPDITVDTTGYSCLYSLISAETYEELDRLIVVPVTLSVE